MRPSRFYFPHRRVCVCQVQLLPACGSNKHSRTYVSGAAGVRRFYLPKLNSVNVGSPSPNCLKATAGNANGFGGSGTRVICSLRNGTRCVRLYRIAAKVSASVAAPPAVSCITGNMSVLAESVLPIWNGCVPSVTAVFIPRAVPLPRKAETARKIISIRVPTLPGQVIGSDVILRYSSL